MGKRSESLSRAAPRRRGRVPTRGGATRPRKLRFEPLEDRRLLSVVPALPAVGQAHYTVEIAGAANPDDSTSTSQLTPEQVRVAYGLDAYNSSGTAVNNISFQGVMGNGAGQTIAIVDAYDDPNAVGDLNTFSSDYGLPQFNGTNEPTFEKLDENGGTNYPSTDPAGKLGTASNDWEAEESLDIEWAHVMAPMANIILFEASSTGSDLYKAVATAASTPGVVVVSMSWSANDSQSLENIYDSYFTTPLGHLGGAATMGGTQLAGGVSFFAATGDTGAYAYVYNSHTKTSSWVVTPQYPASSPNVVAVGGTTLTVGQSSSTSDYYYDGETSWGNGTSSGPSGGGGGGVSAFESQPSYQSSIVSSTYSKDNGNYSTAHRTYPDVSLDADSSVLVYDSYSTGGDLWAVTGTSLACPLWAGMVAVADQGRAVAGLGSLYGNTQTLPELYSLASGNAYSTCFNDVTTGSSIGTDTHSLTYSPGTGYDLATGLGSPKAGALIPALAGLPVVSTNPTSQTVTAGNSATFTVAAVGNPTPTVQWFVSTNGGTTFTAISGATSATYSFTTSSTQNGNEYEAVFTNTLGTATTTAATLTVQVAPVVTTNPTSQTVTAGNLATFTAAGSGSPTPSVQWEVSTNGGTTFNIITGATSATYSFTTSSGQNGNEYEAIFTNAAGSVTTTSATLTVQVAPSVTTNPTSETITVGNLATFTAAASGSPTPSVQWYVSTNSGAAFAAITGATFTTYSFTASFAQNGNEYEAVFINAAGALATSAATLTVQVAPSVTTNPTSQTVAAGNLATFTAAGSGSPTPSVQWEVSTNGGTTFNIITGATSAAYSFTASSGQNGNEYEAVFTNAAGSATTSAATMTVQVAPSVTMNPTSETVTVGNPTSFTAAAGGNPTPNVQWDVNTGSGFTALTDGGVYSGSATDTLTITSTTAPMNGYQYEAVFTNAVNGGTSVTSASATLTVQYGPSVTTSPTSQTVVAGSPTSFTATAGGNPTPSVQWEVNTGSGFTALTDGGIYSGSATDTLTIISATAAMNGYQYEAVFSNGVGTATTSTAATLTVQTAPSVTTSPTNQTVMAGSPTSFTAAASGNPTPSVQWEVNTGSGFTALTDGGVYSGSATDTLTITSATAAMDGYQYEAVFSNGIGTAATSASATLTVQYGPVVTASPADQAVDVGATASFTAAAGGDPVPSVQWEVSSDGGATFTAIRRATSLTYSFAASAAQDGNEYEAVFTNAIGTATTTPATLTVQTAAIVTANPINQAVADGGTATFTAAATGNPTPSVQWEVSTDGGTTFSAISGATSVSYSFTASAAQDGNEYEAVFTNAAGAATTVAATLTIASTSDLGIESLPAPTEGVWNATGDGLWNSAGNWSDTQGGGVPGFSGMIDDTATFNGAGGQNIFIGNASPSIAGLTFGASALDYNIQSTGNGQLVLANDGSNVTITVMAGKQEISCPVAFNSDVTIDAAAGSELTISGAINAGGHSITVSGSGTVEFSGPVNNLGNQTVTSGRLIVATSSTFSIGGSLTIGDASAFTASSASDSTSAASDSSAAASPAVASATASVTQTTSVPAAQAAALVVLPSGGALPIAGTMYPWSAAEGDSAPAASTVIASATASVVESASVPASQAVALVVPTSDGSSPTSTTTASDSTAAAPSRDSSLSAVAPAVIPTFGTASMAQAKPQAAALVVPLSGDFVSAFRQKPVVKMAASVPTILPSSGSSSALPVKSTPRVNPRAPQFLSDFAWVADVLAQQDSSNTNREKSAAIRALDAVLAEYAQA